MLRVAVLVSGRGSNLEAILQQQAAGALGAEVALVVCNHPDARALEVARRHGVETLLCGDVSGADRTWEQLAVSDALEERGIGLVVLAGYDRVLTSGFVRRWEGRIMNIHPSLLPAFGGGLRAQQDAVDYGVKVSGCTVHMVTDDLDAGPIVSQAAVPVFPDDDGDTLAARILEQEHRLLPEAIRQFARGRLEVAGRRMIMKG